MVILTLEGCLQTNHYNWANMSISLYFLEVVCIVKYKETNTLLIVQCFVTLLTISLFADGNFPPRYTDPVHINQYSAHSAVLPNISLFSNGHIPVMCKEPVNSTHRNQM